MLRDLAIEIAVSAGLGFCAFWFFPFLMAGLSSSHPIAELLGFFSFIGFVLLLYFSARHLKSLLSRGKTKQAIFFTALIVAVMLIILLWLGSLWQGARA